MDSGDLVYLATTSSGAQHIVRTNRAYDQTKLNDFPGLADDVVPWATEDYLLKSTGDIPLDPDPDKNRIGDVGCNLTTTANVLSYYANDVTPAALQEWLIQKWTTAPAAKKATYITARNDFAENFTEEFTRERFNSGLTDTIVTNKTYVASGAPGNNRQRLIDALQAGDAVKLRVPSGSGGANKYGHYVLAYGLVNPAEPDTFIENNEILIHDPGHGNVHTLADYEQKWGSYANWLDDTSRPRLQIYSGTKGNGPLPKALDISVFSPVDVILIDPLGRRVGFDASQGVLSEAPGSQYWVEESYSTLDDGSGGPLSLVWTNNDLVKHLRIENPMAGEYSMELVGTGNGSFEISIATDNATQTTLNSLAGQITSGQRLTQMFSVLQAGDFDRNGVVNGADLGVWSNSFGQSGPGLAADADSDLDVDGADFLIWQQNLNVATSSAVPEPRSFLMALCALARFLLRCRR
jgi:hypothetical protein